MITEKCDFTDILECNLKTSMVVNFVCKNQKDLYLWELKIYI